MAWQQVNFPDTTTKSMRLISDREKQMQEEQLAQQQNQWSQKLDLYKQLLNQRTQQQTGLAGIVDQYNKSFAEAKAANEAKYKQALGLTDQVSGQQAADIRSSYAKQRSTALQNLARSGMSGTTVGATLQQGLGREENAALSRLSDQLLGTKLGVMQGFQYQEPNAQIPTALIQALSQQPSFPNL